MASLQNLQILQTILQHQAAVAPLLYQVPTVVHTPVETPVFEQTLPHNLTHLFEEEEVSSPAPSEQESEPT